MSAPRIALPARPRILIVGLRRLGDVLLSTPLIRSLRRAWPDARIEVLVFAETAGILDGNPDVDRVLALPGRPSARESAVMALRLLRRYDLAVSTQSGDRPTGYANQAGRQSAGPVEPRLGGRIKGALLGRTVAGDPRLHRVEAMLRIADALGVPRVGEVVPPAGRLPELPPGPFAVVHATPMFHYKRWTQAGWRALAGALRARGLTVIATGGPAPAERAYLDATWDGVPVLRREGQLGWGELATLLARAHLYVGPDTSVTHLAAAAGCPTVALYGPTDPRLWGPWPVGGLREPWAATSRVQRRGNVWLVQHAFACTPCQLEGCERRLDSPSACLDALDPDEALVAVEQALAVDNVGLKAVALDRQDGLR
jgi:heptosyltransferase-3